MRKLTRKPILGEAFDSHFMNDAGRVQSYVRELEYYRPRGFASLAREGATLFQQLSADDCPADTAERMDSWINEVESLLTDWARRVTRNDYICFGPFEHCGAIGFYVAVESAMEDCELRLDAGDSVPRGFSGMAAFVTDHGNVAVRCYSRGRMTRELFDVV